MQWNNKVRKSRNTCLSLMGFVTCILSCKKWITLELSAILKRLFSLRQKVSNCDTAQIRDFVIGSMLICYIVLLICKSLLSLFALVLTILCTQWKQRRLRRSTRTLCHFCKKRFIHNFFSRTRVTKTCAEQRLKLGNCLAICQQFLHCNVWSLGFKTTISVEAVTVEKE